MPNSSILKTCPCKNTLCKFAWHCPGFEALSLLLKIAFAKNEKLCRNCLTAHKNECTFRNWHSCSDKHPHHIYLCSNEKTDRKIGGVNFASHHDANTVENVMSVLEDLIIEPLEFTEVLGQNIFDNLGDTVDGYSSDSDSDSESIWDDHSYGIGGLNSSKIAQVGIDLCRGCLGIVCSCCSGDEHTLGTQVDETGSNESLDLPGNQSPTSMSTALTECPVK